MVVLGESSRPRCRNHAVRAAANGATTGAFALCAPDAAQSMIGDGEGEQ